MSSVRPQSTFPPPPLVPAIVPAELDVTLLVPCLNEAKTLTAVVEKGLRSLARLGLRGEVLVSDNGSTDGSIELAQQHGARVTHATTRGYGALCNGIRAARGHFIVMGDADDTYNFEEIDPFIDRLRDGADLVMGTRLPPGTITPGANPWLNRYVGTPVLTFVLNRLFGMSIHDCNCGMRGFSKQAALRMDLESQGMEFASEMIIKAALHELRVEEVPVTLYPDRRGRAPHLRRWRDGWRHLEFMLLYAPDQLLFKPGFALASVGLLLALPVAFGPVHVLGHLFDFHMLFYGGTLALVGLQGMLGAIMARAVAGGVIFRPSRVATFVGTRFTFGRGLALSVLLIGAGLVLEALVLGLWLRSDMGPLSEPRRSVLGMLLVGAGAEVGLFAFVHAVLRKHVQRAERARSIAPSAHGIEASPSPRVPSRSVRG